MGGYKRSMIARAAGYFPAFKYRKTGWGLNTGWRRALVYKYRRTGTYLPYRRRRRSNFNIENSGLMNTRFLRFIINSVVRNPLVSKMTKMMLILFTGVVMILMLLAEHLLGYPIFMRVITPNGTPL